MTEPVTAYRTDHYRSCPASCQGDCYAHLPLHPGPEDYVRVYRTPGYPTVARETPPRAPTAYGNDRRVRRPEVPEPYEVRDGLAYMPLRPKAAPLPMVVGGMLLKGLVSRPNTRRTHGRSGVWVQTTCVCGRARAVDTSSWRRGPSHCRHCPEYRKLGVLDITARRDPSNVYPLWVVR